MPQIRRSGSWSGPTIASVRTGGTNWSFANALVQKNGSFEILITISTNQTNVNVAALFGSYWVTNIKKTLTINSGVVIGSPSVSDYPLYINPNLSGTLTINNNGSIQGAGGAANGGTGGNAIYAGSAVTINNQGTIYAGGGGGGQGGTGGQGYTTYLYDCNCQECCNCGCCNTCCGKGGWCWCCGKGGQCCNCYTCCDTCTGYNYYAGGAGGTGGIGQGYAQTNTNGSAGSAGGTNAGNGGTGGNGGTFGNSGTSGGTGANGNYTNGSGGSAGGLAGYYIVNNGNVTWSATGTRAGRVG